MASISLLEMSLVGLAEDEGAVVLIALLSEESIRSVVGVKAASTTLLAFALDDMLVELDAVATVMQHS